MTDLAGRGGEEGGLGGGGEGVQVWRTTPVVGAWKEHCCAIVVSEVVEQPQDLPLLGQILSQAPQGVCWVELEVVRS